ncbi:MAG: hypothetical protein AAFN78_18375 [Pseudomonadota bacterium]
MKKLSVFLGSMFLLVGSAHSGGGTTLCVSFEPSGFCDGLQLTTVPGTPLLVGTWDNYDCAGSNAPMQAFFRPQGNVLALCTDPGCLFEGDWLFRLNLPTQTFSLARFDGTPALIQPPGTAMSVTPGLCPFRATEGGVSSRSLLDAL